MAEHICKTPGKMSRPHSSVGEDSSVLGCDTVCLVSSSEVVCAFIFKVKHSQKNASFLDSLTLKMAL